MAQALVIIYPGVLVFWFIFHTRIEYWRTVGKQAYWYASVGWPVISSTLLVLSDRIFQVRWPVRWWMTLIGILAAIGAFYFGRQAAKKISGRALLGLVELEPRRNVQPLLQTGIYSNTRNPIYLAHWLLILAAAALSGYAANWIFFGLDSLLLPVLIRTEEKELTSRYGREFKDYMRRVPRFFPRWPW